jgi:hypothetical protein
LSTNRASGILIVMSVKNPPQGLSHNLHQSVYLDRMLTKKTKYARAMWEISHHSWTLLTTAIAERQQIPPKYFPQIVSELSRTGTSA